MRKLKLRTLRYGDIKWPKKLLQIGWFPAGADMNAGKLIDSSGMAVPLSSFCLMIVVFIRTF